jgi:nucleoside-diphosphate-sugar epimerase
LRIFLTGGSGFVGQHLIHALRADGHDVVALARSAASAEVIIARRAAPVRGDLSDLSDPAASRPDWLKQLTGVDAVVHAAARMEFWGPDEGFVRDNHQPTVALHAAAAAAGVSRFVLLSAAAVSMGGQRAAVVNEDTEERTPNTAYGRVKLATERALQSTRTPGMTLVILRPPLIWGAGMTTITAAAETARRGQWMWIDHGRHVMDYVHVDNLADSVVLALTKRRHNGLYYVTDGNPLPLRDFFTALMDTQGADISGSRSVPRAIAAPLASAWDGVARLLRRPTAPPVNTWLLTSMGRDRSYDISAARRDLGYEPRVSLSDGLAEMAALVTRS